MQRDIRLEPTGERLITEDYLSSLEDYAIYVMHLATYRFAEPFTRGRLVLDYGCGSGYGSALIAESAAHVTAVDVAKDAVDHARHNFVRPNLAFQWVAPDSSLPAADGTYDTVLSFQVLEHLSDPARYLSEVRRVLKDGGHFLLATPNRRTRLLPFQRPWNRWHVHEYDDAELARLLGLHFSRIDVMNMTATPELLKIELRRCRRVKWLMLPLTLPVLPDRARVAALNLVHRIRGRPRSAGTRRDYPWTVSGRADRNGRQSINELRRDRLITEPGRRGRYGLERLRAAFRVLSRYFAILWPRTSEHTYGALVRG